MNKRHVQWLYEELPDLVGKSVIPADVADQLRQHYGPAEKQENRRLLVALFGVIGAVLIGGGISLLLAHNWEQFSRPLRAALSFAPLLVAQALAGWTLLKRRESLAWREGVGAAWTLAIGISLALISQTYNLGGDFGDFVLTWTLLGLPVIYLMRSSVAAALYWVGVTAWAVQAQITHGPELWFWPLMMLAVPHLLMVSDGDRYRGRMSSLIWILAICGGVGIGAGLVDQLTDYWMLVYSSVFTVYWLAGRHWFPDAKGLSQRPLQSMGGAGMMAMALLLTFKWPWQEMSQAKGRLTVVFFQPPVAAICIIAALCLWGISIKRRDRTGMMTGLISALAAWGFLPWSSRAFVMPLVFDVYLLAVGLTTVTTGARERQMGKVNGGMLILSALIIARFFDSELNFVARGLAFVAVGTGFLVTNLWLVNRVKVAQ